MMNYYIADTHFGCSEDFLEKTKRPFDNPWKHDRAIIEAINDRTSDGDHLWIAGDFYSADCARPDVFPLALRPTLHLVIGNHDAAALAQMRAQGINVSDKTGGGLFDTVFPAACIEDGERSVYMCHYPLAVPIPGERYLSVHGHIHDGKNLDGSDGPWVAHIKSLPRTLNACVDVTGFEPVSLNELIAANKKWRL